MKRLFALIALLLLGGAPSGWWLPTVAELNAQAPAMLATARAHDWTYAGAGVIPARATVCTNWFAQSGAPSAGTGVNGDYSWRTDTSAMYRKAAGSWSTDGNTSAVDIVAAVAACPSGQTVYMNGGTYTFASSLKFVTSNVTIRGAGPDTTFWLFPNDATIFNAQVNILGLGYGSDDGSECCLANEADWSGGLAQGSTSITISNQTTGSHKPVVGDVILLDQLVDGTTPAGDTHPLVWQCIGGLDGCLQGYNAAPLDARGAMAIASITRSGATATVTMSHNHPWVNGDRVSCISTQDNDAMGSPPGDYDGAYTITKTGATTFTFTVAGTPANQTGYGTCAGKNSRAQLMQAVVTSISAGSIPWTVGLSVPVAMPNWNASNTPKAWWSTSASITAFGFEGINIRTTAATASYGLHYGWASNSWVKNVVINNAATDNIQRHIRTEECSNLTIRDSYFFGKGINNDQYKIDLYASGNFLIENNIFQRIAANIVQEMSQGNVVAYNYDINHLDTGQGTVTNHGSGGGNTLLEGNDGVGFAGEDFWGYALFTTLFRNHFIGKDTSGTALTTTISGYYGNRFFNIIGNVLGNSAYHVNYQTSASDGQNVAYCNTAIYAFGLGASGGCAHGTVASSQTPPDDANNLATHFRFGNWDTKTNAVRWCGNSGSTGWATTCGSASEVPTALSNYAQTVPASETLPNSFYLAARPSAWWKVNGITPVWPPIGPDVTGASVSDAGGHVARNPARICFEDVMGGAFGDTTAKTFNANTCYSDASAGGGVTTGPPAAIGQIGR